MNDAVRQVIRCPVCGGQLDHREGVGAPAAETFACGQCSRVYPVVDGIPRMTPSAVDEDVVARSFGFQWAMRAQGRFEHKTLYGLTEEQERANFFQMLGTTPGDLSGRMVLDAGCGDGFLLESLSAYGAEIVGIDISTAVSVPFRRCRHLPNVSLMQADIMNPCFAPASFDVVWCEGVIVHTPDPRAAFQSVCELVKHSGRLFVWVYPSERPSIYQRIRDILVFSHRIPRRLLFGLCSVMAVALLPLFWVARRQRSIDTIRFDLFDNLSPRYQWRFTEQQLRSWFLDAGFTDLKVTGRIGMSGRKGPPIDSI